LLFIGLNLRAPGVAVVAPIKYQEVSSYGWTRILNGSTWNGWDTKLTLPGGSASFVEISQIHG